MTGLATTRVTKKANELILIEKTDRKRWRIYTAATFGLIITVLLGFVIARVAVEEQSEPGPVLVPVAPETLLEGNEEKASPRGLEKSPTLVLDTDDMEQTTEKTLPGKRVRSRPRNDEEKEPVEEEKEKEKEKDSDTQREIDENAPW